MSGPVSYFDELRRAMTWLGQDKTTVFLGQGVGNAGTTMSATFDGVPADRRIEFPVAEDLQMGTAIGLALAGFLPICVFPRWNFALLAANQLINHLDRLPLYSADGYRPKVIVRTAVPATDPFDPGPQHNDDFTRSFQLMARTLSVLRLGSADNIVSTYKFARKQQISSIVVEYVDLYKNEPERA